MDGTGFTHKRPQRFIGSTPTPGVQFNPTPRRTRDSRGLAKSRSFFGCLLLSCAQQRQKDPQIFGFNASATGSSNLKETQHRRHREGFAPSLEVTSSTAKAPSDPSCSTSRFDGKSTCRRERMESRLLCRREEMGLNNDIFSREKHS